MAADNGGRTTAPMWPTILSTITGLTPKSGVVLEIAGGVSSTIVSTYEPENGEAEYHVKIPVLRELAASFLTKLNEDESKAILANAKAKMEA